MNSPKLVSQGGAAMVKRYVHTPLTIDHYGITAEIKENGRILISKVAGTSKDGVAEFDEVEVPASLIFKLATLLTATRKVAYVPVEGEQ